MSSFTLTRTGQAPLKFDGEIVAEASSHLSTGQEANRWHEVRVYRIDPLKHVVEVIYRTCWQGEQDYHWVLEAAAPSSVEMRLREIGCEIAKPVKGYPAGGHYAEKQARMLGDLQQRFEHLISEVLSGDEFAETLE